MRTNLTALLILAGLIAPAARAADRGDKIAVMALRKDVDLPDGTLRTLNEVLLNEFHQQGKLEVLGASDIESMLTLEATRQKFSACEDDSCLAEIGGALGVQLMAAASLGAVGDKYVVNIKILDVSKAEVLSRTSEIIPRDDSELIEGLRRAVGKVLAAVVGPVLKDKVPGQAAAGPEPGGDSGAWGWAPWATLGVAVVAAGVGGAMGGLALGDAKDARAAAPDSDRWRSAKDSAEGKALGADLLFGLAGAAAVTTVVLFVLRPSRDEIRTEVEIEPSAALMPGGAAAGLTVRF